MKSLSTIVGGSYSRQAGNGSGEASGRDGQIGNVGENTGGRIRPGLWRPRTRRIILLLLFIWMVNLFDLALTLVASQSGEFVEMNPLADMLLHSPAALSAFKLSALVLSTVVFMVFRRHWLSEAGCWILWCVYTGVALVWAEYSRIPLSL